MGGEKMKKNPIVFLVALSLLAFAFLMINFVKENEKKQVAAEKITTTSNSLKKKALKNSIDSSERKYYSIDADKPYMGMPASREKYLLKLTHQ